MPVLMLALPPFFLRHLTLAQLPLEGLRSFQFPKICCEKKLPERGGFFLQIPSHVGEGGKQPLIQREKRFQTII